MLPATRGKEACRAARAREANEGGERRRLEECDGAGEDELAGRDGAEEEELAGGLDTDERLPADEEEGTDTLKGK